MRYTAHSIPQELLRAIAEFLNAVCNKLVVSVIWTAEFVHEAVSDIQRGTFAEVQACRKLLN